MAELSTLGRRTPTTMPTKANSRRNRSLAWWFLGASLAGLALSAFIAWTNSRVMGVSTSLIEERLPLLEDIAQAEKTLSAIQNNSYQYFSYAINREAYLQQQATLDHEFRQTSRRLAKKLPTDQRLLTIKDSYESAVRLSPKLDAIMAGRPQEKAELDDARAVLVEITLDGTEIGMQLASLRKFVEGSVVDASARTEANVRTMTVLVTVYSFAIFAIAILVGYHIRARALAEAELAYHAAHDLVTDLFDRRALERRIEELSSERWALLVISIERFHRVVGTLGHDTADAVLREFASRLADIECVPREHVFRLDGAQFAVLHRDCNVSVEQAAAAIAPALTEVCRIGRYEIPISVFMGAAKFPTDGSDAVTLMRSAHAALQQAQRTNELLVVYSPSLTAHSEERFELELGLARAVQNNELALHYQPQIDLTTGELLGFEALLRWRHNERQISPAEFIPVAEETGAIVPIGTWVLRTAMVQAKEWERLAGRPITVAINVSARQFDDPNFVTVLADALHESAATSSCIELEITEGAIMRDPDSTIKALKTIKDLGFRVSVDDFGTGYSSLAYLERFPIDKLKVDQSFVRRLAPKDPGGRATIIEAVVRLGQALGLRIIAEGVETPFQRNFLMDLGCEEAQGFLFSKPLPLSDATSLLRASNQSTEHPARSLADQPALPVVRAM